MSSMMPQQQIMFCGYASKQEAADWHIAPGYILLFIDPDQMHVYRKELAYGSYQPGFSEYEMVRPAQTIQNPEPTPQNNQNVSIEDKLTEFMEKMTDRMDSLERRIDQKPYYNKKEGNK